MSFAQLLTICVLLMFPLIGSGPFWNAYMDTELKNCRSRWWLNLLYVNNYIKTGETVSGFSIFILFTNETLQVMEKISLHINLFLNLATYLKKLLQAKHVNSILKSDCSLTILLLG